MRSIKAPIFTFWIYFGEVLVSSLFYGLLLLFFSPTEISAFVIKASEHLFSKFTYIMLIASIGFYWVFCKQSDSSFSRWLYKINAYDTYSRVFLFTIAIYFLTLIFLSVTELTKDHYVALVAGWLVILASINVFTFFKNIYGLMKLMVYFNSIYYEIYNKNND